MSKCYIGIDPGMQQHAMVVFFNDKFYRWYGNKDLLLDKLPDKAEHTVFLETGSASSSGHAVEVDRITEELAGQLKSKDYVVHKIHNTGIRKLITDDLLKLLDLYDEAPYATHHYDLRSAARILILGMAKHDNETISNLIERKING